MPPVIAAGAALLGGAAAKAVVGGMLIKTFTKVIIVGAISGAIGGAVSAAMTGGNILKGALGGAVIGGITAGLANKLAGVTMGMEAATGVPEVAGGTQAGAMAREGISSADVSHWTGDITNGLWEEAGLNTSLSMPEKLGEGLLTRNMTDSAIRGGSEGGGLTKGIQGFWNNLGSEGKAGALNLVGGALKGVGEWQKGKQEGKMADKAWERRQITDVPELQSRGQAQLTAPHWDRLNFSRAPEQPTSTNPYAVNMV